MKKLLTVMFSLLLVAALLPFVLHAASAETYSGECGDDVYWSFDTRTGELIIYGWGEMNWDYERPWSGFCEEIRSVTIEYGVTNIWYGAFEYCTNLSEIEIPDSVTTIHSYAFYECSNLCSVTIPDSVTDLESYAFDGCTGLTSIRLSESLDQIGYETFAGCSALESVIIPDRVSVIDRWAFECCTELESIQFGSGLRKIRCGAFDRCYGLESLVIPDGVTDISTDQYEEDVNPGAFGSCTSLTSLTIPCSTKIGPEAFLGCTGITEVHVTKGTGEWELGGLGEAEIAAPWYDSKDNELTVTLDNGIICIGNYAFMDCTGIKSITIPDTVENLGVGTFIGCTGLQYLQLGRRICSLGGRHGGCFENCTSLVSVAIPDGITDIGDYAFYNCTELTSVTTPGSVTYIGKFAFANCSKLKTVTLAEGLSEIDAGAFSGCASLTSVVIPDGVTEIYSDPCYGGEGASSGAFMDCTGLKTVSIPYSMEHIGENSFYGCSNLRSVKFDGSYAEKECIDIDPGNDSLLNAVWKYKSTIAKQPKTLTVQSGKTAKFKVEAHGQNLKYQWYYRATPSSEWKKVGISAGKKAIYKFKATKAKHGYEYRCKVTTKDGKEYSDTVRLLIKNAPKITSQPANQTGVSGESVTLKTKASGKKLKYQWYYRTSVNEKWIKIDSSAAKKATYTVKITEKKHGFQYRCRVSNSYGSIYTKAASMTDANKSVYRALLIAETRFSWTDETETAYLKDAQRMQSILKTVMGPNNSQYSVTLKTDLGERELEKAIKKTFSKTTNNDVSLFFIVTHGRSSGDGEMALRGGELLDFEKLEKWLSKYIKGKVIVLINSCGAGSSIYKNANENDSEQFVQKAIDAFAKAEQDAGNAGVGALRKDRYYVLAAANHQETMHYHIDKGSYFVDWIIEGIGKKGKIPADINKDGVLTLNELYKHLHKHGKDQHIIYGETLYQHVQVYPKNSTYPLFKRYKKTTDTP